MKYSIEQLTEHVAMLEVKRDKGLIFNLFELIACSQLIAAEARIAEYGMSPGHAHQRLCESRAARNELGFGEDADDVAPADLREAIQELRKRAEAAEAQIKELTADLDKESEIRHRIHEELNAIKGEQQPVVRDELIAISQRLLNRYIANKGTKSEFICCVTPERSSIGTGGVWDDWRAMDAAIESLSSKLETGAKPLPVLDIRHIGHSTVQISGQRYTYLDKEDVLHALKDMGIKIRTQDADPAEGQEVKS